jgi:branched-chain amino acid transport system permease protein
VTDAVLPAAPPRRVVQRWTRLSALFTSGLGGLIVLLVFVPVVLSENATQKLTSLYILVILSVMWNVLAGYGGLVSVGLQAFIGTAAYSTLYLSYLHGMQPFLAMLLATLFTGAIAIPISFVVLQLRGGGFAIGTWVVAEIAMILFTIYPRLGGGTGLSFNNMTLAYPDPHQRRSTSTGRRSGRPPCCCCSCSRCCAPASGRPCRRSATTRTPRRRSASG